MKSALIVVSANACGAKEAPNSAAPSSVLFNEFNISPASSFLAFTRFPGAAVRRLRPLRHPEFQMPISERRGAVLGSLRSPELCGSLLSQLH